MQVTFIHHSCFLVEIDRKVLIFDYFRGDRIDGFSFKGRIPEFAPETEVYVFASHKHRDHFDPVILDWANSYPNIRYILSRDIHIKEELRQRQLPEDIRSRITFTVPGRKYKVGELEIETLRSTDAGVAYYIQANGISLFHAGDLADWVYEGCGELTNGMVTKNFRAEMRKLSGRPLNVAFVPMDPRQKEYMYRTVDFVLQNTDAEYVFPMHMWQDYSGIAAYRKRVTNRHMAERLIEISRENQIFPFGEE